MGAEHVLILLGLKGCAATGSTGPAAAHPSPKATASLLPYPFFSTFPSEDNS